MGRTRNTLTPMIGLSLAALVTGSLVTLAVLAQQISLDIPLGDRVLPRPPQAGASAPPLVVENAPPASADGLDGGRERDLDVPPDRVLPLRIARPAVPAKERPSKTPGGHKPKGPKEPKERAAAAGLPPGIVKKINRGGALPPGHAKRVVAGAKRFPQPTSNGRGRGTCGEPPCGHAPAVGSGKVNVKKHGNGNG